MKKNKVLFILSIIIGVILSVIMIVYLLIRSSYKDNIPILVYNNIVINVTNKEDTSLEDFKYELYWLKDQNYKSFSIDDLYNWKSNKFIAGKKVMLTFDGLTSDTYQEVITLLEKYKYEATFFINDNLTEEDINEIKNHSLITLASKDNLDLPYSYIAYSNSDELESIKEQKYLLAFTNKNSWINRNDDNYSLSRIPINNKVSRFKFKLYVLFNH